MFSFLVTWVAPASPERRGDVVLYSRFSVASNFLIITSVGGCVLNCLYVCITAWWMLFRGNYMLGLCWAFKLLGGVLVGVRSWYASPLLYVSPLVLFSVGACVSAGVGVAGTITFVT